MSTNNSFGLPEQLGTGALLAVDEVTPRKDLSVQFAHLRVIVENTPPDKSLNGTAVAMDVEENIRRRQKARHEAYTDELRRRGEY